MKIKTLMLLLIVYFLSSTVYALSDKVHDASIVLRDKGISNNIAYSLVEELTTTFGARPAGSVSEKRAAQWGVKKLKSFGFANVRTEVFPIESWLAGESVVRIVKPNPQSMVATTLGGSPPSEGIQAQAAVFKTIKEFNNAQTKELKGKIAVVTQSMPRTKDGKAYVEMVSLRMNGPKIAASKHALGFVMRSLSTSQQRYAHSGGSLSSSIPAFSISGSDAEQIERLSENGNITVWMRSTGTTQQSHSQNVIAEIEGTDLKDEIVLISAHLDSWEQGTGAIDDGFGIATITAAAKLILDQGINPRRTIRIVWFGAEELTQAPPVTGFAGAYHYVANHKHSLQNHVVIAESDWGGGFIYSLTLPPIYSDNDITNIGNVLAPLNISMESPKTLPAGPDISLLQNKGVPAFRLNQDASGLFDIHHSPNDVLSRVDKGALNQNVAAWAALTWILANN